MKKFLLTSIIALCCILSSCLAPTYSREDSGVLSSSSSEEYESSFSSDSSVKDETNSSSLTAETDSSSSIVDTQITLLTAHFDYGMHVEDQATLLLSGSTLFFDLEEYGIDRINAGDVIEVTYRGEFYVLENYPSTVVTDYMEIVDIRIIKTKILVLDVRLGENGKIQVTPKDESGYVFNTDNLYVVNQDRSYELLGERHIGATVYATLKQGKEENAIAALYSYAPIAVSPHTCTPIYKEIQEPTCQEAGKAQILCTYCSYVFEEEEIPVVDCVYDADSGACKWCGEYERVMMPCCICGSYTCNGHE